MSVIVTTTNGIESQYKKLKHHFLKEFGTGKSLQNAVDILLQKFFPENERSYKRSNVMAREDVRCHAAGFPEFLLGRPKNLIAHCIERMPPNVTLSDSSGKVSDVDGIPSCTCMDFIKTKWPCKHILHSHSKGDVSLKKYLSHPVFTLDESVFDTTCPVDIDDTSTAMEQDTNLSNTLVTEKSCRRDCIEQIRLIENGLYLITDVNQMEAVLNRLQEVSAFMDQKVVKVSGLTMGRKRKWKRTSIRQGIKKKRCQKKTVERTATKEETHVPHVAVIMSLET
ncbi:uncharacterized protein [Argopecten irradians]|uniref:uncharacterized protein n=1 Tax=Argopecten irradians TaxID=31199 RepID=UPI0037180CEE